MRLHKITQIETQKRNENRVSIYLDGSFAFGIAREVLIQNRLHEGDELSKKDIEDILLVEEIRAAKDKALRFLSYRDRSVLELTAKLADRDFSEWVIDIVVRDFLRVGLLDDDRFARAFAQTMMTQKPVAKRLLMHHLKMKGIEGESARLAVEEAYQGRTEAGVAGELASRRLERLGKGMDLRGKKRISDFLARRGFAWETIRTVLKDLPEKE
jgi:regulatory protein